MDPVLQAVLEEAYAPLWVKLSEDFVDDPSFHSYPGRERERRRREELRRGALGAPS